jgi:peptide/nickel transport system permease protein
LLPYVIRRFVHLIPTFVGATLLMFLISQLVPGDFFTTKALEPNVRPETIERLRAMYGLDQPVFVQYVRWMGNLVRGDLGLSFSSNQPVVNLIRRPIQNSMVLTVTALVLLWLMAIPLGVYSAVRQYSLGDQAVSAFAYFGLAIPNFFFAQVLILGLFLLRGFTRDTFDFNQLLLPVAGMTSTGHENLPRAQQLLDVARHTILPAFVVATAGIAGYTRVLRGQML